LLKNAAVLMTKRAATTLMTKGAAAFCYKCMPVVTCGLGQVPDFQKTRKSRFFGKSHGHVMYVTQVMGILS